MIKKCECGGPVAPKQMPGRYESYNDICFELPEHLNIPTCKHCGEEYLNDELCKQIDAILEEKYKERINLRLLSDLAAIKQVITFSQLEQKLRLSRGYLTRLQNDPNRNVSPVLVIHIARIAQEPLKELKKIDSLWESLSDN